MINVCFSAKGTLISSTSELVLPQEVSGDSGAKERGMPYKTYFESATEALIIADRFGSIIEVNPRASELFGYGSKELEGQKVEVLLPRKLGKTHEVHRTHYFETPRT